MEQLLSLLSVLMAAVSLLMRDIQIIIFFTAVLLCLFPGFEKLNIFLSDRKQIFI